MICVIIFAYFEDERTNNENKIEIETKMKQNHPNNETNQHQKFEEFDTSNLILENQVEKKITKRINVLIPYLGKAYPKYFEFFLKSASKSQKYQFIIFLNNKPDKIFKNFPSIKIFIVPDLLKFVCQRIFEIFKIDLKNNINTFNKLMQSIKRSPHRLTRYKPLYGRIFENFLDKSFDHWCWSDIDVFFGYLDKFTTDDMLDNYGFFFLLFFILF